MWSEEEKGLEKQLEVQLQEQRESLAAIDEALLSDSSNQELLSVHQDLILAIRDAEEGLLQLKRARLLEEADLATQASNVAADYVEAERLAPPEVGAEALEEQSYSTGSKCRFRHTDGHWYDGQIVAIGISDVAKISFLTPTSESMSICKFFLQKRCRFGTSCRLSHGVDVPLSSLKKYVPTVWEQSRVGSSIWAAAESKAGIWRRAELESWDDILSVAQVVFHDDGTTVNVGAEAMSLSEYAIMTDEEDETTSEDSDCSEYDLEKTQGIGFLECTSSQKGIQKETAIFAKWENHTRGIASKMMASMGYREGMGLGITGQGMVDPILVKVLPPKQSLDHAFESQVDEASKENTGKKHSRGGKRKRDKKFAAAARAAKVVEMRPDVFSLINDHLAMHVETLNGRAAKKQQNEDLGRKEDRRALVAYNEEVKELKMRAEKLEEMVNRNKKEKAVYEAAMRKLKETREALAEVEAAHASTTKAVVSKEKEKRWLKF